MDLSFDMTIEELECELHSAQKEAERQDRRLAAAQMERDEAWGMVEHIGQLMENARR